MNWFVNLNTAPRLLVGFGAIVLLLGLSILAGYRGMEHIREQAEVAAAMRDVEANLHETRAVIVTLLLDGQRNDAAARGELQALIARNDDVVRRLELMATNQPALAEPMREFLKVRDEHRRVREQQLLQALAAGQLDAARTVAVGPQMETYTRLRKLLDTLGAEAQREAERSWVDATRQLLLVGVGALAATVLIVALITRLTAPPLRDLALAAERIAQGELEVKLPDSGERRDEIGVLTVAFERMSRSLREMAEAARRIAAQDLTSQVQPQSARDQLGHAFATMVSNLRNSTTSLADSVNVLAASASEILATTTQVASGAAETGTAIAQTSTTVEEVKQTAQQASQKARQVADRAHRANQVSDTGRQSVEAAIERMRHIQGQMASIAETVVRLSEHSQAIGEIIAAVNDLAEQSNLLAVNAAIEAAKAGEQGKGFSVVAQEVRSLAEQSRQATAQVRAILHDIQKATSAAVMATEQGSKSVEAGVRQSAEAGEAIAELADTLTEAVQAATQIAASSQQQLVGTDQVAQAMQNIKQASMQNVSATRQAETAAHNLHEIGRTLKDIVAQYKL